MADYTKFSELTGANLTALINAAMPSGLIMPFGNTTAPTGFLACDGSAVSRTTYADLFTAIATVWGVGDGSTTFNVPDFRGASVRGTGSHGSEVMADGNPFAGPAVGAFENDQVQGHYHTGYGALFPIGAGTNFTAMDNDTSPTGKNNAKALTEGNNGPPRDGDETRPFAAGVLICIKT